MQSAWAGPAGRRSLATISEVDEENWETVQMDEKLIWSVEHRAHMRAAARRRNHVAIIIGVIFGLAVLSTLLVQKSPTIGTKHTKTTNTTQLGNDFGFIAFTKGQSVSTSTTSAPTVTTIPSSVLTVSTKSVSFPATSVPTTFTPAPPEQGFPAALQAALTAVPSDSHYATLLSTAPATPLQKLSHLAAQIKSYTALLSAFEALHRLPSVSGASPLRPRWSVPNEVSALHRARLRERQRNGQAEMQSLAEAVGETIRQYETFRYLFKQLSESLWPWFSKPVEEVLALHARLHRGGRGAVMVVEDGTVDNVIEAVGKLRRDGSRLDVEIMYAGRDKLSREGRRKLEKLPGTFVTNLESMLGPGDGKAGWRMDGTTAESLALLMSDFREAVLLDIDAMPQRPEKLFHDAVYRRTGATFLNVETGKGKSGAVIIAVDKIQHFVLLMAAVRLSGSGDLTQDKGVRLAEGMRDGSARQNIYQLAFEIGAEEQTRFHSKRAWLNDMVEAQSYDM